MCVGGDYFLLYAVLLAVIIRCCVRSSTAVCVFTLRRQAILLQGCVVFRLCMAPDRIDQIKYVYDRSKLVLRM